MQRQLAALHTGFLCQNTTVVSPDRSSSGAFLADIRKDPFAQKSIILAFLFFFSNCSLCPYFSFLLLIDQVFVLLVFPMSSLAKGLVSRRG